MNEMFPLGNEGKKNSHVFYRSRDTPNDVYDAEYLRG